MNIKLTSTTLLIDNIIIIKILYNTLVKFVIIKFYKLNHYRPGIQDYGMMPIKTYKHHISPNDPKFDHWRTPLDPNIEWKSQDFHDAIHKIEPYKYARRIPVDKLKSLPPTENTSLKTSPILSNKEIPLDIIKTNTKTYNSKIIENFSTNTSVTNDEKVLLILVLYNI